MKLVKSISFLSLRETHSPLQLPVFFFFFLSFFCRPSPEHWGIQTIEQLIQYTVLEINFWSLKYTAVIGICKNWKLHQGAKCLHCNWDFMNKIEVRSNTEFSQPYCACPQKQSFVGRQTGIKKTYNIKKEKRNLMYLCDREITTKLVFNILILDLNKKKKQI